MGELHNKQYICLQQPLIWFNTKVIGNGLTIRMKKTFELLIHGKIYLQVYKLIHIEYLITEDNIIKKTEDNSILLSHMTR